MDPTLTSNPLSLLMVGSTQLQPILQVVAIEQIFPCKVAAPRYWLYLSDGTHKHVVLLPSVHNPLETYGELQLCSTVLLRKKMLAYPSIDLCMLQLPLLPSLPSSPFKSLFCTYSLYIIFSYSPPLSQILFLAGHFVSSNLKFFIVQHLLLLNQPLLFFPLNKSSMPPHPRQLPLLCHQIPC